MGRDFDLSGSIAVFLAVLGDGRGYQTQRPTDALYRGMPVSYGAGFDTTAGEWTEVRVPLASMKSTVRGPVFKGRRLICRQ